MSKHDAYFQFPLHALYRDDKPLDKVIHDEKCDAIQRIVSHTVLKVGHSIMGQDWSLQAAEEYASKCRGDIWNEYDEENETHVAIILGCRKLGVTPGGFDNFTDERKAIRYRPFGNRTTRIRGDILWNTHNNRPAPWREFAVLSAVYAGIGNKQYCRLSYNQIRSMAMGYNGIQEYEDHAKKTPGRKKDHRLTVRQTQITVHHLYERGLFVRLCPNGRHVYYSNRMTATALGRAIIKREVKHKARKAGIGVLDKAVGAEIKAQVAALTQAQVAEHVAELGTEITNKPRAK